MKKINMNIDEDLLARIDDAADRKHITRTAYMLTACEERLAADAFLASQPDIMKKMVELKDALSQVAMNTDKDELSLF